MAKRFGQGDRLRNLLAQECAKIIASEGVKDFAQAKRKAVARLGADNRALLPSNVEIEQALVEYQRLFMAAVQPQWLRRLREAAVQTMRFLAPFRPRLVGPVLHGTAGAHSDVNLHVFAATPEDIIFFLLDHRIEFTSSQRRLRLNNGAYGEFPVIGFAGDETAIDLTVFAQHHEHAVPRSPIDGRPMKRASLPEVEALLAAGKNFNNV